MKISTIFFDLGKVLVDYDFNIAAHRVLQKSPLTEADLNQQIYDSYEAIDQYESGKITTEEFFKILKKDFKFSGEIDELKLIWCEVFSPLSEHIQMAKILAQYYPLAIISNTSEAHIDHLEKFFDFFPIFQKKIYSYEVGCMKPKEDIYLKALEEMKADKFESLFIDDREENIVTPSKMGWQTIHLRPEVNLREALQSYDLTGI